MRTRDELLRFEEDLEARRQFLRRHENPLSPPYRYPVSGGGGYDPTTTAFQEHLWVNGRFDYLDCEIDYEDAAYDPIIPP